MKDTLAKILKIVMIVVLLLITVCALIFISLYMDRSWWFGLFVTLVLILAALFLWLVFWLCKKAFLKLKKKQDNRSESIAQKCRQTAKKIKKSHLKESGNPLYVLPWYMIMGHSRAGKTTAISNCGLASTIEEIPNVSEISQTANCDWFFFENAIIVDTAGRYAVAEDKEGDKKEWQTFVSEISKYRKKEPINGVIAVMPADRLLEEDPQVIKKEGLNLRLCIQDLMRKMKSVFPVYILVTKCDLIKGMNEFCKQLPDQSLKQALGYSNQELSMDAESFLTNAFDKISEKLTNLRLLISNSIRSEKVKADLFFFPEEFKKLKPGIKAFSDGAFKQTVYQETPLLRGIFFTSARQSGEPKSALLENYDIAKTGHKLPDTSKSLFLHDLFSKILPEDRKLFSPTKRVYKQKRIVKNCGIGLWIALVIFMGYLLSLSFMKNLSIVRDSRRMVHSPPKLSDSLASNLKSMEELSDLILRIETQNNELWILSLGLNQGKKVEKKLKNMYCTSFKEKMLSPYDKKIADYVITFSGKTPEKKLAQTASYLVRRLNLLQSRLKDKKITIQKLQSMPAPNYAALIRSGTKVSPKILQTFEIQYIYYLLWGKENIFANEIKALQSEIEYIVTRKDIPLNWLTVWCNNNPDFSPITLEDFWKGSDIDGLKEPFISSSYTVAGKQEIESFINELKTALPNPFVITKKEAAFLKWYKASYLNSWFKFGLSFSDGVKRLSNREEMGAAVMRIGTNAGPYFSFLKVMTGQLEPFIEKDSEKIPPWIKLIIEFETIKEQALKNASQKRKPSVIQKVANFGKKKVKKLKGFSNKQIDNLMKSADAFNGYKAALASIREASFSPQSIFQFTSAAFKEDSATGKSAVFIGTRELGNIKKYMTDFPLASLQKKMFFSILKGPLDYLWNFFNRETSCHLQSIWEQSVLLKIYGTDSIDMQNLLFGETGYATEFVNSAAGPFLDRSVKTGDFYPRTLVDQNIPFTRSFLRMITNGHIVSNIKQESYSVTIEGGPIDVNKGAHILPHLSVIELECSDGLQALENRMYPESQIFLWSPEKCRNTFLKIYVGDLTLVKKYKGFGEFLKQFSKGSHTFKLKDFKESSQQLKRLGIDYITVSYKLSGHLPVIKLISMKPRQALDVIVKCGINYCQKNQACVY